MEAEMVCLFCGRRLVLERSLKNRWAFVCGGCGFKGPDGESTNQVVRDYERTVARIPKNLKWLNDWARFRACDESGKIFEYECEPKKRTYDWTFTKGRWELVNMSLGINWESSLEKREVTGDEQE